MGRNALGTHACRAHPDGPGGRETKKACIGFAGGCDVPRKARGRPRASDSAGLFAQGSSSNEALPPPPQLEWLAGRPLVLVDDSDNELNAADEGDDDEGDDDESDDAIDYCKINTIDELLAMRRRLNAAAEARGVEEEEEKEVAGVIDLAEDGVASPPRRLAVIIDLNMDEPRLAAPHVPAPAPAPAGAPAARSHHGRKHPWVPHLGGRMSEAREAWMRNGVKLPCVKRAEWRGLSTRTQKHTWAALKGVRNSIVEQERAREVDTLRAIAQRDARAFGFATNLMLMQMVVHGAVDVDQLEQCAWWGPVSARHANVVPIMAELQKQLHH
jgi:hypothetical protein